jgi:hypothetical protein
VVWVAGLVALAVVAAGVLVLGDTAQAGEVILEPAAAAGSDPFFESIATSVIEVDAGGVDAVEGGDGSVESVSGDAPGLYGGTRDDRVCDVGALVAFLEENRAKAEAFAGVLGISTGDIAEYLGGLTPVLLREDTRVTNHGFRDGAATPRHSVLQAGTAVLVDARGVPRVRCACGNPLTEPAPTASAPAYQGDKWAAFDPARVVAVAPASPVASFTLVDVATADTYDQPTGSPVGGGLTVDDLLSIEVPHFCEGVTDEQLVRLVDGTYECGVGYHVSILGAGENDTGELQAVVGDLTGDGANEGVISTSNQRGQAGNPLVFAYVYSSEGELLAGPDDYDLPGRPTEVRIVDGILELSGREFGECNACPLGPPFTVRYRLDGDRLVDPGAVPTGSGDDLADVRETVQRYLDVTDFGCPTELSDRSAFISDVDPTWAHTGWFDPRPTPQCQGGTIAVHKTASGWAVSEGFGKCPAAVDREFRDRVGPNAGC